MTKKKFTQLARAHPSSASELAGSIAAGRRPNCWLCQAAQRCLQAGCHQKGGGDPGDKDTSGRVAPGLSHLSILTGRQDLLFQATLSDGISRGEGPCLTRVQVRMGSPPQCKRTNTKTIKKASLPSPSPCSCCQKKQNKHTAAHLGGSLRITVIANLQ